MIHENTFFAGINFVITKIEKDMENSIERDHKNIKKHSQEK